MPLRCLVSWTCSLKGANVESNNVNQGCKSSSIQQVLFYLNVSSQDLQCCSNHSPQTPYGKVQEYHKLGPPCLFAWQAVATIRFCNSNVWCDPRLDVQYSTGCGRSPSNDGSQRFDLCRMLLTSQWGFHRMLLMMQSKLLPQLKIGPQHAESWRTSKVELCHNKVASHSQISYVACLTPNHCLRKTSKCTSLPCWV